MFGRRRVAAIRWKLKEEWAATKLQSVMRMDICYWAYKRYVVAG